MGLIGRWQCVALVNGVRRTLILRSDSAEVCERICRRYGWTYESCLEWYPGRFFYGRDSTLDL